MNRILAATVVLGTMAFGVGPALADMGQPETSRRFFCFGGLFVGAEGSRGGSECV